MSTARNSRRTTMKAGVSAIAFLGALSIAGGAISTGFGAFTPSIVNAAASSQAYYPEPLCSVSSIVAAPVVASAGTMEPDVSPEVTPEATDTPTVTPDIAPEITPEATPSTSPTDSVLTVRSGTVTESPTVSEPTVAPSPADAPDAPDKTSNTTPKPTASPSSTDTPTNNPDVTPEPTASPSPTDAPTETTEETVMPLLGSTLLSSDPTPAPLPAPYGAPCAPYALQLETAPTQGIAQIEWEQSNPTESVVNEYTIQATSGGRDITFLHKNSDPTTQGPFTYTMWGLEPDANHTFTVTARNLWRNYDSNYNLTSGVGETSDSVTGRTKPEANAPQATAPGVVLAITATVAGNGIAVSWTAPTDAGDEPVRGYVVEIDGNPVRVVDVDDAVNDVYSVSIPDINPGQRDVRIYAYTENLVGEKEQTSVDIANVTYTLSYAGGSNNLKFDKTSTKHSFSPSLTGGTATEFSITGTLPVGVTFYVASGKFEGPSSWAAQVTHVASYRSVNSVCFATANPVSIKCSGDNSFGRLGNGTTFSSTTPVAVSGLPATYEVLDLQAYGNGACAALDVPTDAISGAGPLYCWGANITGERGDGTTTPIGWTTVGKPATAVSGMADTVVVGTGHSFVCGLTASGVVKCWGASDNGQLGNGLTSGNVLTPYTVSLPGSATQLFVGYSSTCARVTGQAALHCWGMSGFYRTLGTVNDVSSVTTPSPMKNSSIVYVAPQGINGMSAGLDSSGDIYVWGDKQFGLLGDASTATGTISADAPQKVNIGEPAKALVGSSGAYCAVPVNPASKLRCWGRNYSNNLGALPNPFPITSFDITDITSITRNWSGLAGGPMCAVTSSGVAKCMGLNDKGAFGIGSTASPISTPTNLAGLNGLSGWPVNVTVSATDGVKTTTADVTLEAVSKGQGNASP